ncbi:hypothetical protein BC351_00395 [Paenibacillus ferrarius]|uniref:Bacillus phage SPbeta YonK domain-containing protein n=1 Tax=Paenibacillus ferrarius TaxID=1469647 RepID=A0A1V4HT36_9BACL|nr:YonK family protein [Paenibacillus ferrarius]OPH61735.1 hypothetical protein BC351_00395 [Paenibacillus ferrarius]
MAKRNNSVSFKGLLDVDNMTITEETKDGIFVYSVLEALREYDGKEATFSLKEDTSIKPLESDGEEE